MCICAYAASEWSYIPITDCIIIILSTIGVGIKQGGKGSGHPLDL